MRWLQLSDLHMGMRGVVAQQTALGELVQFITDLELPWELDAILVAGDITYAGRKSEYEAFAKQVVAPLRATPAAHKAILITTPGNHDLDCDKSLPLSWDSLGPARQNTFFEESSQGQLLRAPRAESFREYGAFVEQIDAVGPNPLRELSSAAHRIHLRGQDINIICTNTAFFSDKDPGLVEEERAPAPTPSLRARLQEVDSAEHTLILGHHPIEWFIPANREPLKSLLVQRRAIYLHGHTHQIQTRMGPNGVLSLGFGATYQAAPDANPSSFYNNSFAICELTDALHVQFFHWDAVNGRWVLTTGLPSDFRDKSEILAGGFKLNVTAKRSRRHGMVPGGVTTIQSVPPAIERLICIGELTVDDWVSMLVTHRLLESRDVKAPDLKLHPENLVGRLRFTYQTAAGRHGVDCISGRGHILSRGEIEAVNTHIDSEDLVSYSIVSFGEMADDARTLYLRLSAKKPLRVLTGDDLVRRIESAQTSHQTTHTLSLEGISVSAELLLLERRLLLMVTEKRSGSWFYVVGESAAPIDESDSLVRTIRQKLPYLAHVEYRPPGGAAVVPWGAGGISPPSFDREEYLATCHLEFNSVRYTALAAIGLRFNNITLEELYVAANASPTDNGVAGDVLMRAIDDALAGLKLDEPMRAQLEAQIRHQHGLESAGEPKAARWLYQQYGSVLLLGDPGSGKTCFVKHEIMAYCQSAESWYKQHTPIYVPLAEVAKFYQEGSDLIQIACAVSTKRGLRISEVQANELIARGATAFFFDGVDEVVSLDKRSRLVDAISSLMDRAVGLGNRFVVTSRPAAVQVVDMPPSLKVISLRGLTTNEMRTLATRLLATRLISEKVGARLSLVEVNEGDRALAPNARSYPRGIRTAFRDLWEHRPGIR